MQSTVGIQGGSGLFSLVKLKVFPNTPSFELSFEVCTASSQVKKMKSELQREATKCIKQCRHKNGILFRQRNPGEMELMNALWTVVMDIFTNQIDRTCCWRIGVKNFEGFWR